ncbi:Uncharacterized protein PECH_001948 [Penicillium ucsense]|uniref:Sphingomyelin phosphodiesterase n=1 Tax=Penicillium ucsense TaxID=2839758 RepID=A0A8J8WM13_9EURO|nr:Uncharacterized protein PECM_008029 [Penicillium ucsense]KAF7731477.1 Uncharacterized protein PECH_001948 [Penicillium ucsense]
MKLAFLLAALVPIAHLPETQAANGPLDKWVKQIWNEFKDAVDCGTCQALLGGLKVAAGFGEDFLKDVLIGVCDISRADDPDVCAGIMTNEIPGVYYAIKNMHVGSHTAKTLCSALVGLCDFPNVRPYDLKFPSPKPDKRRPPPSGKAPLKVVHFTDTHVDLSYEVGSNSECTKPICCRTFEAQDAPGMTSSPCGPFGNTKCDAPEQLQASMMTAIASMNPAFSIYTGDVVAHDVWLVDKAEVLEDFNKTYGMIEEHLGLVYPAMGNHDTAPLNLVPSDKLPGRFNPQWAFDALTSSWLAITGAESVSHATKFGSYSAVHPNSHLRIISYNSIFYYKYNFFSYTEPMEYDPDGQFAWLINELQSAESANQRVWLISHIPSGDIDHFRDHSHYFDQIVQRYEATIAAFFYGHTHTDAFQISYSDYKNRNHNTANAVGYIAPSMTPTSGSPSFRVYEIDPETYAVMDYTQYIANITDPSFQANPVWIPYYSAKKDYGSTLSPSPPDTAELTPAFWHNITVAMEKDPSVFDSYWARRTRGYKVPSCSADCQRTQICALRGADAQHSCVKRTPGLSLSKRGGVEEVRDHPLLSKRFHPECNHAGMAPLLAKIAYKAQVARANGE